MTTISTGMISMGSMHDFHRMFGFGSVMARKYVHFCFVLSNIVSIPKAHASFVFIANTKVLITTIKFGDKCVLFQ